MSVTVDLERVRPVSAIRWVAGNGGSMGTLRLQVSTDGTNWRDLEIVAPGQDGWSASRDDAGVRYVRFAWTGVAPPGNLAEIEIYP